jgi:hypothetical protein
MKRSIILLVIAITVFSCGEQEEISSVNPVNWERRAVDTKILDSLEIGETYLSVYSEIYSLTEHRTHNLTATISMRNTNLKDTIYVSSAKYYNTKGELIRNYFDKPIFILPMETVEIIIDQMDKEGGTGGNFMFDWKTKPDSNEPLFDGVMISTSGQQGISFTTSGKRVQ